MKSSPIMFLSAQCLWRSDGQVLRTLFLCVAGAPATSSRSTSPSRPASVASNAASPAAALEKANLISLAVRGQAGQNAQGSAIERKLMNTVRLFALLRATKPTYPPPAEERIPPIVGGGQLRSGRSSAKLPRLLPRPRLCALANWLTTLSSARRTALATPWRSAPGRRASRPQWAARRCQR